MGLFEDINDRLEATNAGLQELIRVQQAVAFESRQELVWKSPAQLAKQWSLDVRSVNNLVAAGKEAGVVQTCLFRVTRGGRVMERVEVESFRKFMELGGVA